MTVSTTAVCVQEQRIVSDPRVLPQTTSLALITNGFHHSFGQGNRFTYVRAGGGEEILAWRKGYNATPSSVFETRVG